MALKLFCSNCTELIKEITPSQASRLPEEVICKKCKTHARNTLDEVKAVGEKAKQAIAGLENRWILKMEETGRKFYDDL